MPRVASRLNRKASEIARACKELGHKPDMLLAQELGISASVVRRVRVSKGIPVCGERASFNEKDHSPINSEIARLLRAWR